MVSSLRELFVRPPVCDRPTGGGICLVLLLLLIYIFLQFRFCVGSWGSLLLRLLFKIEYLERFIGDVIARAAKATRVGYERRQWPDYICMSVCIHVFIP